MAREVRSLRPILLLMFLANLNIPFQLSAASDSTKTPMHLKSLPQLANSSHQNDLRDHLAQEQRLAVQIITTDPGEEAVSLSTAASNAGATKHGHQQDGRASDSNSGGAISFDDQFNLLETQLNSNKDSNSGERQQMLSKRIVINLNALNSSDPNERGTKLTIGFLPMKPLASGSKQQQVATTSANISTQANGRNQQQNGAAHRGQLSSLLNKSASGQIVKGNKKESGGPPSVGSAKKKQVSWQTTSEHNANQEAQQRVRPKMREAIVEAIGKQGGIPAMVMNNANEMFENGMDERPQQVARPQLKFMVNSEAVDLMRHGAVKQRDGGGVSSSGTNMQQQITRPLQPSMQPSESATSDVSLQEAIEDLSSEIDSIAKHLEDSHDVPPQFATATEHFATEQRQALDNNNNNNNNDQRNNPQTHEASLEHSRGHKRGDVDSFLPPNSETRVLSESSSADVGREFYDASEANDGSPGEGREGSRGQVIVAGDGSAIGADELHKLAPEAATAAIDLGGLTNENIGRSGSSIQREQDSDDGENQDDRHVMQAQIGTASEQNDNGNGNNNDETDDSDNQSYETGRHSPGNPDKLSSLSSSNDGGEKVELMNDFVGAHRLSQDGHSMADRPEREQMKGPLLVEENSNLFNEQIPHTIQATSVVENTALDNNGNSNNNDNDQGKSSEMSASGVSDGIAPDTTASSEALGPGLSTAGSRSSESNSGGSNVSGDSSVVQSTKKSAKQSQQQQPQQQRQRGAKAREANQRQHQQKQEVKPQQANGSSAKMDDRVARMLERLKLYTTKDHLIKVVRDLENNSPQVQSEEEGDSGTEEQSGIDIGDIGGGDHMGTNDGSKVSPAKRNRRRLPDIGSSLHHRPGEAFAPPMGQWDDSTGESLSRAGSGLVELAVNSPSTTNAPKATKAPEHRNAALGPISKNQILESLLVSASNTDGRKVADGIRLLREFRLRQARMRAAIRNDSISEDSKQPPFVSGQITDDRHQQKSSASKRPPAEAQEQQKPSNGPEQTEGQGSQGDDVGGTEEYTQNRDLTEAMQNNERAFDSSSEDGVSQSVSTDHDNEQHPGRQRRHSGNHQPGVENIRAEAEIRALEQIIDELVRREKRAKRERKTQSAHQK